MNALNEKWNYDSVLWSNLGTHRRNQERFESYVSKYKSLDSFFQRVVKDVKQRGRKPIIAFGSAKYATTSKGEVSGPLKMLRDRSKIHAPTIMTNEFRTSQKCNECHEQLIHPIRLLHKKQTKREFQSEIDQCVSIEEKKTIRTRGRKKVQQSQKIRDLVWCPTNHKHKYMNRDVNASANIGKILQSILSRGCRPNIFSRENVLKRQSKELLVSSSKRKRTE